VSRHASAARVVGTVLAGCSGGGTATHPSPAKQVPTSALDGLLPNVADIDAVMGTGGMTVHQSFSTMEDHRNLLPNLNCLGIWQIGEKAIYGRSNFAGVRGQVLREPDTDGWTSLVIQAVVSYLSANSANAFFDDSSGRWSRCTNHKVNLTVNDRSLGSWTFGNLTKTATELTMPMNRTGAATRACQRAT
jgi:PknH-like extracellular domain